jgi:hypothetical protein
LAFSAAFLVTTAAGFQKFPGLFYLVSNEDYISAWDMIKNDPGEESV